jgi:hypothetical protein
VPNRAAQRLFFLQLAQAGGVGRGDVDGDVVGQRVHARQAVHVVAFGRFVRRVLVLADVDAEQAAATLGAFDVAHQHFDAFVVEAEAIDHRAMLRQAEHARLRITRLRLRRDRADLDEAESQRQQRIDMGAVLVEPGGEADRFGKSARRPWSAAAGLARTAG